MILTLKSRDRVLFEAIARDRMPMRRLEEDLLRARTISVIRDRDVNLVPRIKKVARVVVNRLVENLAVANGDNPAGELPAINPRGAP